MSKNFSAGSIQGRPITTSSNVTSALPGLHPNEPWEYMFMETRWKFDDKYGFYPSPGFFRWIPGVENFAAGNDSQARGTLENRGWRILRQDDARLGDYRYYLREYDIISTKGTPGKYYASMFMTPRIVGKRMTVWKRNDEEYFKFLKFLVKSNILPPLDDAIKEDIIIRQTNTTNRCERAHAGNTTNGLLRSRYITQLTRLYKMQGKSKKEIEELLASS